MKKNKVNSIVFLGTGPSSGVPNLYCLTSNPCSNCLDKSNKRTCVSLLLETNTKPIIIDCGKDFKHQYERYLLEMHSSIKKCKLGMLKSNKESKNHYECSENLCKYENYSKLPSVLLTHCHADAILGLDSLKQMTPNNLNLPIYSDQPTLDYLDLCFGYLFHKNVYSKTISGPLKKINIKVDQINTIEDVEIVPFYVEHGDSKCLGYKIDNRIVYISDCSSIDQDEVYKLIFNIETLILECTSIDILTFGHLRLKDSIKIIDRIKPKKTYLIGMSHTVDCTELKGILKNFPYDIEIAHDNLRIDL
ncbi:hypothetical protein EDEG_02527 [Edhazardia aedis USNM 41457]|uniref:Metallo-beta-lactamase domain-containing protein n=1 Tax=Edhazardia aedis (strain USNM 41457) TaxID=1003232 RepID=J9DP35_EDHAE|nr:hypothetical protein EDEG_02527 [Edhazardia aedis USNM 41457]|eukprot:EJW03092.1 hypothetical protein EDEG_02527 [Edhazardia aedis USNM 41457]